MTDEQRSQTGWIGVPKWVVILGRALRPGPPEATHMHIIINGERRELEGPMTVQILLEHLELDSRRVAVEINRRILKRAEFETVSVSEGDQLEVVHFIGGG